MSRTEFGWWLAGFITGAGLTLGILFQKGIIQ